MEYYAEVLLIAIPGFFILLIFEGLYGHFKKNQTLKFMDTLSSLCSGITNILKDSLGIIFIIISYPYLLDFMSISEIEASISSYIIAFICIDFASYWGHRLSHKVNIFWNKHVIHHSSEEFNLACALRQSISTIIGFRSIFLIPAAIIGFPSEIIITLTPIHLFAQFWYHTQHIGKLGILEYIIVTPSQHRVHHAINPIYIDKNLSAIFCIWDRIFGTFQEELDNEKPVYGVLSPVRTWNPVLINFQHFFSLLRDFWYTKKINDKIILWFMPTGWRPNDVSLRFPKNKINNIKNHKKYNPTYSYLMKSIALFHFISINIMLSYLLINFKEINEIIRIEIGLFIFISVFGFTSYMDKHKWSIKFEFFRSLTTIFMPYILIFQSYQISAFLFWFYIFYGSVTFFLVLNSKKEIFSKENV